MKILLIGGYGMLGRAFPKEIPRTMRETKGFDALEKEIRLREPEYVINCSGIIGHKCKDISETLDINVALPIHLAKVCKDVGANLIQYSTFYEGNCLYTASKRFMEEILLEMPRTSVIYLPTLFDEDFDIAHYNEKFHLAYTKDVADWTLNHLDTVDVFLCNEGYPERKEFINYVGRDFNKNSRNVKLFEEIDMYQLLEMRHWKEAVDEIRGTSLD